MEPGQEGWQGSRPGQASAASEAAPQPLGSGNRNAEWLKWRRWAWRRCPGQGCSLALRGGVAEGWRALMERRGDRDLGHLLLGRVCVVVCCAEASVLLLAQSSPCLCSIASLLLLVQLLLATAVT